MRRGSLLVLVALLGGCASPTSSEGIASTTTTTGTTPPTVVTTTTVPVSVAPTTTLAVTTTISPFARPDWLGTRILPLRGDGYGQAQPTPPGLEDRRLETLDLLSPPADEEFESSIGPVPKDVLARASWSEECPVGLDDLAYLTMSHYGFDGRFHTGEMIVNADVADDVISVFGRLHEARFPIEQIRVIASEEIDAPPTGDGNDTTSFVCRPVVRSSTWSQHAYGRAIDLNPFHNPYLKGDLVLPELASSYLDRGDARPGMISEGDIVTEAFGDIGWGWGGRWNTLKDWMHFSRNGR